ncbi:MAG: leucyl aminopeptidase [Myxococcota bacterium]
MDLLVVPVPSKKLLSSPAVAQLDKSLGGVLADIAKAEGFNGSRGQVLRVPARGRVKAKWVVLVGTTGVDDAVEAARLIGHKAAKASKRQKTAAVVLPEVNAATVRAVTEALHLGAYRYAEFKTGSNRPKGGLSRAAILVDDVKDKALKAAVAAGRDVAYAVGVARDLVNGPPNEVNPLTFADRAKEEAEKLGLKVSIWNKKKLQAEGMNLFLAVNSGSAIEPRLIHVSYEPEGAEQTVAFVGKGLTFDAGGLCIKPAKSMVDMKCDMAGGAATLGIVLAAAALKVPVAVHAIIGCTENMTGAAAYRPGDVFKSHDGKTVEIINTDAEGRLVLADCLSWVSKTLKPDIIIDHATLTGACMVALGPHRAALYTDDAALRQGYEAAAELSEERFWNMPLDKDLRSQLDSFVADVKHTGGPYGGSITAALFLREFVGKSRWMHLDIAGPAFNDGPHGQAPKGGTGFGVSTGVRFLEYLGLDTASA